MTEAFKPALASKTILGGVIAILPLIDYILVQAGISEAGSVTAAESVIVSAVGGALSILGRMTAKKKIKGVLLPRHRAYR